MHEYTDEGITGSGKKIRPAFDAMMTAASQRKFDLLLFWKLDRFSREGVRATLVHLTKLEGWGCAWRSYSEPYFDSCGVFRDAVISIMATLASQERVTLSERTRAGLARTMAKGTRLGRPVVAVDMHAVRARRDSGASIRVIAEELGVSASLLAGKLRQEQRESLCDRIEGVSLG